MNPLSGKLFKGFLGGLCFALLSYTSLSIHAQGNSQGHAQGHGQGLVQDDNGTDTDTGDAQDTQDTPETQETPIVTCTDPCGQEGSNKVLVCHGHNHGKHSHFKTLCLDPEGAQDHMANHSSDSCGECKEDTAETAVDECTETCGDGDNRVLICHHGHKNPNHDPISITLCVAPVGAQHHIEHHGDECGACNEVPQ